jgi:hypothetical protein
VLRRSCNHGCGPSSRGGTRPERAGRSSLCPTTVAPHMNGGAKYAPLEPWFCLVHAGTTRRERGRARWQGREAKEAGQAKAKEAGQGGSQGPERQLAINANTRQRQRRGGEGRGEREKPEAFCRTTFSTHAWTAVRRSSLSPSSLMLCFV